MKNELQKRILSSIFLISISFFFIIEGSFLFIFFILISFCIIIFEWYLMSKNKNYFIPGLIFLFFSFVSIYNLRVTTNDYLVFLFVTSICILTDIGGYIFGKLIKGPKLTKFSPNKTYAGMFGGYLLSFISIIFISFANFNYKGLNIFIFILIISTVSQLGDIFISYFKRLSKIKDTGKIIPGHGGILDRVDGMIFAFPVAYFIITKF